MLKRPTLVSVSSQEPPEPPKIELIDGTRLECVLVTGVALTFDLTGEDHYREDDAGLCIQLGKRLIKIRESRILYTEVRPEQFKRIVTQK